MFTIDLVQSLVRSFTLALKSSSSRLRTCQENPTKTVSSEEFAEFRADESSLQCSQIKEALKHSHLDIAVKCSLVKYAVLAHGRPTVHDLIWMFAGFEEFEGFVLHKAPLRL